jgi:hypothetical protein
MADPTSTETTTSNIPAWAKDYADKLLGFGAGLALPKYNPATGKYETGFQPYQGQLVAEASPLQQRAWGDVSQMGVAPQIGQATGLTGLAALQAQNLAQYQPMGQQQYYRSPFETRGRGGYRGMGDMDVGMGGMGGGPRPPSGIQQYMSPYIQNVLDVQKQQAVQDYARQIPGMQAATARTGARGGTRDALVQSEANRNLQQQLQGIQATGLQNAYQTAAQQALQEAQMRAQYGLQGQQLAEQSRQFGAGIGLQGLEAQRVAAKQLADIGGQQYQQQAGILDAQLKAGQQQQALKQQMLASNYQRFVDEMQYPYKQLDFFSNLLRGIPASDSAKSTYTQGSNILGQLTSLTGGLGGLFGTLGGG